MNEQTIESTFTFPKPENDYERGQDAFIEGDAHLYLDGSDDFKAGYKDRFDAHLPESYHDGSGWFAEVAWDQHYANEIERVLDSDLSPEIVYQPTTQELYDELAPDFSPEALYERAGRVLGTPKFDQSFAEIAEDAAKRIAMKNLAVQIVMLALGFLGGYLVTMAAFYGVAGGK